MTSGHMRTSGLTPQPDRQSDTIHEIPQPFASQEFHAPKNRSREAATDWNEAATFEENGALRDAGRALRVLVVDDEPVIASSLGAILEMDGHHVMVATSGEEALIVCYDFKPNVLIADVVMSSVTGIELAMEVCTFLPSCKVMLISGYPGAPALLEEAGVTPERFPLFAKPASPRDILGFVEECGEMRGTMGGSTLPGPERNPTETRQARWVRANTHIARLRECNSNAEESSASKQQGH